MTEGNKRKAGPGASGGSSTKKSKGGHAGKWMTSAQKAKKAEWTEMGTVLGVGDAGIWVTYARGMRGKALREFKELCYTYGESLFNVKPPNAEEDGEGDEDGEQDIEASIKAELEGIKASQKPKTRQVFTPVMTGLECVLFMKTMEPIEPDTLVRHISQDAKACPDPRERKTKYINRLTPVFDTDKATDKGIERVARTVLAPWFTLKSESGDNAEPAAELQGDGESPAACTYAIRHNIRNHTAFKSDAVIKKIAGFVSPKHKVNLTSPDKVIMVEIFQTYCGMSVVDGKQWEDLKRYNINELYKLRSDSKKPETASKETTTNETAAQETAEST